MVADLREMQENQWVSEIQIDKSGFMRTLDEEYYLLFQRDRQQP